MRHIGPKLHRLLFGIGRSTDHREVLNLYDRIRSLLKTNNILTQEGRDELIIKIAEDVASTLQANSKDYEKIVQFVARIFDYEGLFLLPDVDFTQKREVSQYWELKDQLNEQKEWLEQFPDLVDVITKLTLTVFQPVVTTDQQSNNFGEVIQFKARKIDQLANLDAIVEGMISATFSEEIEHLNLLKRIRSRLESNLVVASGGNPGDIDSFSRQVKGPTSSEIKDPDKLVATYLGGTPFHELFNGEEPFTIPILSRYEHHHIVAGTGHGKTQTLQYLISQDLEAVKRGERSVVVIDSQGDLINNLRNLADFAPGGELHDRICIIDPEDIEFPVALNMFDVGQDRLKNYDPLHREQLTNSILELYDFVLGSLLEAEMTQKQQVLFNFVTKLMLEIPGATIHTFRDIFAAKDAADFMDSVNRLDKVAREFFLNEFKDKDFTQTKTQVNRRLLGVIGDRNFERMFSHPKSKFDLFEEMNSGKVILINTAKRLLKASGSELLGRFFIALISQSAQERAVIPENERMPTFVYIDEAADYFDSNIEMILREARKYKVGMVLAHQYLGQLNTKLQDAFSANTTIKFAGGVSAKDARILAQQMGSTAEFLEQQPKLSFASFIKGTTSSAVSLQMPYGVLEAMDIMSKKEADKLRDLMREEYAATINHENSDSDVLEENIQGPKEVDSKQIDPEEKPVKRDISNPDTPNTNPSDEW